LLPLCASRRRCCMCVSVCLCQAAKFLNPQSQQVPPFVFQIFVQMIDALIPRLPTMAAGGRLLTLSYRLNLNPSVKNFHSSNISNVPKRWTGKSQPPFQHELKNPVEVVYGGAEKWPKDVFGKQYDKKPFKVSVKKYHLYKWCGCGWSHSQPFCDETCTDVYYKKVIQAPTL
jgi:hypothetical protein